MQRPRNLLATLCLMAGLLAAGVGCPVAHTWYISPDGTGDAPTIQAGVDSAVADDTVLVGVGVHADTSHVLVEGEIRAVGVVLDKPIVLLGETTPAEVVIDASVSEIAVYVTGVDAAARIERIGFVGDVSGFGCIITAQQSAPSGYPFDVAIQCKAATPTIRENRFRAVANGVFLEDSPALVLQCNEFSGVALAVEVYSSPDVVVQDNTFEDCGGGVLANGKIQILSNDFYGTGTLPFSACSGIGFTGEATITANRFENLLNFAITGTSANALVENNEMLNTPSGIWLSGSGAVVRQNVCVGVEESLWFDSGADILVEENTIDGSNEAISFVDTRGIIQNNIILNAAFGIGHAFGSSATIECNDVYATATPYHGDSPDLTGTAGNIAVDPEFCGVPGSRLYTLQSDSPCTPSNHPDGYNCGRIGAFDVGCNDVSVEKRSWGAIKAIYRGGGDANTP